MEASEQFVYVLYNAGNTVVVGIYTTEDLAKKALLAGKAQHEEDDFMPKNYDVSVWKVPLNNLFSIGYPCNAGSIISNTWIDELIGSGGADL